ncbi:hypothetical protein NliqN6_3346 [Naganishia liquefaciens]|uniref:Ubiquitin-like-conjugating enzyme ATG10 n=1 Tax=Naganishia liquefaciens TaxID=104408 RepID=A0A8H3TVI5_9TREE|nr:hypothetical protein NliqN6_3346 [Naganishia liquefaciens]
MALIFANHQHFELACRHFIATQRQCSEQKGDQDPLRRVQSGWTWRDHPTYPHQGYMYRRDIKRSRRANAPSFSAAELEEEEQDAAAAQQPLDNYQPCLTIIVEWIVVFSKTYRIPQLCFNAYDTDGNALSLREILSAGSILACPTHPEQVHDDYLDLASTGNSEAAAPFPLLQRISHPYPHIGNSSAFEQTVWSIHPCHVQETVAEILEQSRGEVVAASPQRDEETSNVSDEVRWLECWFMVTSTLMNLRP